MSDAQRQAVTELMRSSARVAERPGPHPPGGGSLQGPRFRAKPAFSSVLSSRCSGHTLTRTRLGQDATAPTVTTNDSLQPETAPMGHDRRSLTVPVGGVCCAPPSTCGFRLLGGAYAASGQF